MLGQRATGFLRHDDDENSESIYRLIEEGPLVGGAYPVMNSLSRGNEGASGSKEGLAQVTGKAKASKVKVVSHRDSSQVANLLNPVRGVRDAMTRKGITPKDHNRDVKASIAQQSAKNHVRKLETSFGPTKGLPVAPKSPVTRRRASEPNYVRQNMLSAASAKPTKPAVPGPKDDFRQKENYGKVPEYLTRRKEDWQRDAEQRECEREAAKCPPGTSLMPEDERQRTLVILAENKKGLEAKIQALPLVCETASLKQAKKNLETQLMDLEDAVKRFSRPKVYISTNLLKGNGRL